MNGLKPHRSTIICLFLIAMVLSYPVSADGGFLDKFEVSLGRNSAPQLIKEFGGEYDLPVWDRMWLDELFSRLVEVTERSEIEYNLTVLNSREINAFALPGGYVFVTRGLLNAVGQDPAKMAAVLGHEIAHIERKHGVTAVLRQMGLTVLVEVGMFWLELATPEVLRAASATLLQLLELGWGRDAEFEADYLGQQYAVAAGFDPAGSALLLDFLRSIESADQPLWLFRTHPATLERKVRLQDNLVSFWGPPVQISDLESLEVLKSRRNSNSSPRMDPLERFELSIRQTEDGHSALWVRDTQRDQDFIWLDEYDVLEVAWAPDGRIFTAVVQNGIAHEIWLVNRVGQVEQKWRRFEDSAISKMSWSEDGALLAFTVDDGVHSDVVVSYLSGEVDVFLSQGLSGTDPVWIGNDVAFRSGGQWFSVTRPVVVPVTVENPIPQIVERRQQLSPTIIREGNTITLKRPQLSAP